MSDMGVTMMPAVPPVAVYGRLPRRILALAADAAIIAAVMMLGPGLAAALPDPASRVLNLTVLVSVLLYEPVLVSAWGGTVGHYLLNLQVVSSSTGRRIPFFRALVRTAIKVAFGLLSLLFVAVTARRQALHDVVAGAVVQARDPSRADPAHFAPERIPEPARVGGVSRLRRIGVAAMYVVLTFALILVAAAFVVSEDCMAAGLCSARENAMLDALGLVWVVIGGIIAVLGWRGRLPGARHSAFVDLQREAPALPHS